jgi:hypothetical protein
MQAYKIDKQWNIAGKKGLLNVASKLLLLGLDTKQTETLSRKIVNKMFVLELCLPSFKK